MAWPQRKQMFNSLSLFIFYFTAACAVHRRVVSRRALLGRVSGEPSFWLSSNYPRRVVACYWPTSCYSVYILQARDRFACCSILVVAVQKTIRFLSAIATSREKIRSRLVLVNYITYISLCLFSTCENIHFFFLFSFRPLAKSNELSHSLPLTPGPTAQLVFSSYVRPPPCLLHSVSTSLPSCALYVTNDLL